MASYEYPIPGLAATRRYPALQWERATRAGRPASARTMLQDASYRFRDKVIGYVDPRGQQVPDANQRPQEQPRIHGVLIPSDPLVVGEWQHPVAEEHRRLGTHPASGRDNRQRPQEARRR